MFGLGNDKIKPKKKEELFFDLELELMKPGKMYEYVKLADGRIQRIKTLMRSGDSKKAYDRYNILLQAYLGMLKVFLRIKHKIKK